MEKHGAIPQGYMTVGEVAKKMNTTIRTLQYYDKEGILSPSAESVGGRRLYADTDIIKLHQIQSMKYLGFSLDDIKNRLIPIDTPEEMAAMLVEHAAAVREKIIALSESLQAIETLKDEVTQMQSVDFRKYAAIIVNLQMKNEFYSLIKHFDDNTLEQFTTRFFGNTEGAVAAIETIGTLLDKAIQFQKDCVQPESAEGLEFAKEFWGVILTVTGGDMATVPKLMEMAENADENDKWKRKQDIANEFIKPALGVYFAKMGINPFEGVTNN